MRTKEKCREYILQRKPYLNLASICRELGIPQPHLSMFLKHELYAHYLSNEKANAIVDFIENL